MQWGSRRETLPLEPVRPGQWHPALREERRAGRCAAATADADAEEVGSVKLFGLGPAGKTGDRIERTQQAAYQLICIVLRAQLLEPAENTTECLVGIGDRAL
jgi:hypothetical protein